MGHISCKALFDPYDFITNCLLFGDHKINSYEKASSIRFNEIVHSLKLCIKRYDWFDHPYAIF
jgi:hypothetical protein